MKIKTEEELTELLNDYRFDEVEQYIIAREFPSDEKQNLLKLLDELRTSSDELQVNTEILIADKYSNLETTRTTIEASNSEIIIKDKTSLEVLGKAIDGNAKELLDNFNHNLIGFLDNSINSKLELLNLISQYGFRSNGYKYYTSINRRQIEFSVVGNNGEARAFALNITTPDGQAHRLVIYKTGGLNTLFTGLKETFPTV